jgi:hypothetical protein
MRGVERVAQGAGRLLLVLDTNAGSAAEPLYRSMGWQEVGPIPDFSITPDGTGFCATVLFYRRLGPLRLPPRRQPPSPAAAPADPARAAPPRPAG